MTDLTKEIINIIKNIPEGKVMTYGGIAKSAGSPRGARQVSRVLHSMSKKYNLPWHRVVNSKGEISLRDEALELQVNLLKKEGVNITKGRKIDLKKYEYEVLIRDDFDLF